MKDNTATYLSLAKVSANQFSVTVRDITNRGRKDKVVKARHAIWHFLNIHAGWPPYRIAVAAKRDKQAVINGIESYQNRIETNQAPDTAEVFKLEKEAA